MNRLEFPCRFDRRSVPALAAPVRSRRAATGHGTDTPPDTDTDTPPDTAWTPRPTRTRTPRQTRTPLRRCRREPTTETDLTEDLLSPTGVHEARPLRGSRVHYRPPPPLTDVHDARPLRGSRVHYRPPPPLTDVHDARPLRGSRVHRPPPSPPAARVMAARAPRSHGLAAEGVVTSLPHRTVIGARAASRRPGFTISQSRGGRSEMTSPAPKIRCPPVQCSGLAGRCGSHAAAWEPGGRLCCGRAARGLVRSRRRSLSGAGPGADRAFCSEPESKPRKTSSSGSE